MTRAPLRHLWPLALFAACQSGPAPLPEGTGRGLLRADTAPPDGAVVYARPTWRAGDRFTLVRGEQLSGEFTVRAVTDEHYEVDTGGGRVLRRDLDLGNLGEWRDEGDEAVAARVMSPADVRYHWPLWVGKRWECEFADCARGGQALPMRADYHVEGLDRVEVPAGAFDALRVVRRLRLEIPDPDGRFLTRTQVAWYAPELGLEVRQLLGDTLIELVEFAPADG